MKFSRGGVLVGSALVAAILIVALRPAALVPHPSATPSLDTSLVSPAARTPQRTSAPATTAIVYVAGAVAHPGVYAVAAGARAIDAVTKAGGMSRDADAIAVNLAARVADGDEIAVPHLGESVPALASGSGTASTPKRKHRGRHRRAKRTPAPLPVAPVADAAAQRIDLNTADAGALALVPGIGETLAARIVEFRALNGPFASVDGLADVSGITPSRFDAIAPFLTVGSP